MPFKWNATRVTPIPTPGAMSNLNNPPQRNNMGNGMGGGQRGFGPGADQRRSQDFGRDNNRSASRGFGGGSVSGGNDRRNDRREEKRDNRSYDRGQSRERSTRKRSRSRSKTRSPPRRRARHAPRYNVSVPKVSLRFNGCNVMDLKKRYSNLYIPSDFFNADNVWNEAFPLEAPFKITMPSTYCVMNKEHVVPVTANKFKFDPDDADYSYVAKVNNILNMIRYLKFYNNATHKTLDYKRLNRFPSVQCTLHYSVFLMHRNQQVWSPQILNCAFITSFYFR